MSLTGPTPEPLWSRALRARAAATARDLSNCSSARFMLQRLLLRAGVRVHTVELRAMPLHHFRVAYEWAHNRVAAIDLSTPYPPWIET